MVMGEPYPAKWGPTKGAMHELDSPLSVCGPLAMGMILVVASRKVVPNGEWH